MNSIPLKIIQELADAESSQLRRRYKKACQLPQNDIPTHHMSRGKLIVGILQYEFNAIELLTTDNEENADGN